MKNEDKKYADKKSNKDWEYLFVFNWVLLIGNGEFDVDL